MVRARNQTSALMRSIEVSWEVPPPMHQSRPRECDAQDCDGEGGRADLGEQSPERAHLEFDGRLGLRGHRGRPRSGLAVGKEQCERRRRRAAGVKSVKKILPQRTRTRGE